MKKLPFIPETPQALQESLTRWLPVWLLVLLAYQSADLTWMVISNTRTESPAPLPVQVRSQTNISPATKDQIPDIASMHLFGNAAAEVATGAPVEAPKTNLNLTLHGVFVDQDPAQSGAIIGTSGGNQKYYRQGQVVDASAGVTLSEVRSDQVILFRGGRYESLRFPKNPTAGSTVFKETSTSSPPAGTSISRRNIMENIRVVPVFGGPGGLRGYRLLPSKNRAEYNRLGIRPTDIVIAINGISLKDQREAMRVINELNKATSVEVQVDRNGTLETLTLAISN